MFSRRFSRKTAESKNSLFFPLTRDPFGSKPSFRAIGLMHGHGVTPETIARNFAHFGGHFIFALRGFMLRSVWCHQGQPCRFGRLRRGGAAERSPRIRRRR